VKFRKPSTFIVNFCKTSLTVKFVSEVLQDFSDSEVWQ
jgi:hypothetical protein